jgi:murein DD-endopeptidase MepM/ murein hydrolase activator NlpD
VSQNSQKGVRKPNSFIDRWLPALAWGIAFLSVGVIVILLVQKWVLGKSVLEWTPEPTALPTFVVEEEPSGSAIAALPGFQLAANVAAIQRQANPHTVLPAGGRSEPVTYIVQSGDSIHSIAKYFDLQPETVLWANYDLLNDNPNYLAIDMELVIPPADGILYTWKDNDKIENVAGKYFVDPEDILTWPDNRFDLTDPVLTAGMEIMIPGGWRENQQWLIPTVWAANSGASRTISGPGSCDVPAYLAYGSGAFAWPANNHYLSGNDYWSGHLGIDIAAATGAPVYASDSGMVVYAGSIGGGYGNMVMIDHGNGYHTLYAHLNSVNVSCGSAI